MCGGRELSNIEQMAKGCLGCQSFQKMPAHAPLHPWEWPSKPGQRVHVDYAGHFQGTMFLIVIDAHSKWPEVISNSRKPLQKPSKLLSLQQLKNFFKGTQKGKVICYAPESVTKNELFLMVITFLKSVVY